MEQFAPALVSPAAAFLAHESCNLDGEMLVSGGGQVLRVALVMNEGLSSDNMTPEHIAEHLPELMDLSGAQELKIETLMSDDARVAHDAAAAAG